MSGIEAAGHGVATAVGLGLVGLVQARAAQRQDAAINAWLDQVEHRQRSDAARARGLETSLMGAIEALVLARGGEDAALAELERVDAESAALRARLARLEGRRA